MANRQLEDNMNRLNRIHPVTNFLFNAMFLILALACFLPIIFIFVISITENQVIRTEGYQFFVTAQTASVDAYKAAEGWSDYADVIVGYDF